MKPRPVKNIMATMLAALLMMITASSCVHEFPEPPEEQSVLLEIRHNLSWEELNFFYTRGTLWSVEYIIRVYPKGETSVAAYEFRRFDDDLSMPLYTTRLNIPAGDWDIYVWSEFSDNGISFYDTADFANISYTKPYTGDTDMRDVFEGSTAVSVEDSYDADYTAKAEVMLNRPMAKYVFIATDFEKFYYNTLLPGSKQPMPALRWEALPDNRKSEILKGYSIKAWYPMFMPSRYNMFTQKVLGSDRGVNYSATIKPLSDKEAQMAFDYVMVNHHDTSVQVQLQMILPGNKVMTLTPTISVPLRRGQVTYVRGDFLTNEIGGGVDIDFSFSGDFNIEIK